MLYELEPTFALGYAMVSEAHSSLFHHGLDYTEERLAQAKVAADRALEPGELARADVDAGLGQLERRTDAPDTPELARCLDAGSLQLGGNDLAEVGEVSESCHVIQPP